MGPRFPIEAEFTQASIVASASDAESFGMTLVEAMRCGTAVVSTDCPLGPAEIIRDGGDGRLVPTGDPGALSDALLELIDDEPRRRAMGTAVLESAHRFAPDRILHRYELLLAELAATRHRRAWQRIQARSPPAPERAHGAWSVAAACGFSERGRLSEVALYAA